MKSWTARWLFTPGLRVPRPRGEAGESHLFTVYDRERNTRLLWSDGRACQLQRPVSRWDSGTCAECRLRFETIEEPSASSRAEQRTHAGTKRVVHRSPAPLKARGGGGAPSETRNRLLTTAVPGALPRLDGRAPRQALIENSGVSTACSP